MPNPNAAGGLRDLRNRTTASEAAIAANTQAIQQIQSGSTIVFHEQTIPLSIWTIAHNLGHRPDVTIFDDDDCEVFAQVRHDDDNQVSIIFSELMTGTARID